MTTTAADQITDTNSTVEDSRACKTSEDNRAAAPFALSRIVLKPLNFCIWNIFKKPFALLFHLICSAIERIFNHLSISNQSRLVLWAAEHPVLLTLFYLHSGAYSREQQATFIGRFRHLIATKNTEGDEIRYGLRRSIHRIEKGLIMRPRRGVFAEGYIQEAVQQFAALPDQHPSDRQQHDPLVEWATDVLHEFFAVVESTPHIDQARSVYTSAVERLKRTPGKTIPYCRASTPLNIAHEDMLELAKRRRSVRWYRQAPVPRQLIDNAIDVARWSPSACNRQPFEFRIFDEPELVQRVASIPMGTTGFAHNFPCIAVLVGHVRAFPFERDRHLIYIDGALTAMAFEFALEVQGLSSCSINWPDIPYREKQMAELLDLTPDERPVMLISFGFPDPEGLVPFSDKKSIDELRSYNNLGVK